MLRFPVEFAGREALGHEWYQFPVAVHQKGGWGGDWPVEVEGGICLVSAF